MKLHLGSGDKKYNGFINIDYDKSVNPDFCIDIETERLPFDNDTVEEVIAHHVLEHLGDGYFHALQEIYRVCKHGAIIDIIVPHPKHDTFLNDPTHRRAITADGLWLFSKKYNDESIKQNVAASRLGHFYNVDFEVVDVIPTPEKRYIEEFNGRPPEEVIRYISEHNNIIINVNIKLIVVK